MINPKHNRSRRGVALVVTIGLLAVIILAVVAFSISMRVERLAARNYTDVIQARQWAQSALSTAMDDLSTHIGNNMIMPGGPVYPASGGGIRLYTGEATNYVPASLATAASVDVPWKNMTIGGKTVARIAYQVLDCSGFIDANFGGLTNVPGTRGVATNPMSLWLDAGVLTELVSGRESDLKRGLNFSGFGAGPNTSPWYEYPTIADLWQTVGSSALGATYGAGILRTRPADFFTYSRFPVGYANAARAYVADPVFLGHSQTYFDANKAAIQQAILAQLKTMPGYPSTLVDVETLAANIVDYCDSDDEPSGPTTGTGSVRDSFSMEATPLINEILIELEQVPMGGGKFQIKCTPHLEAWYPFVGYTNIGNYETIVYLELGGDGNYTTPRTAFAVQALTGPWTYNRYAKADSPAQSFPSAGASGAPNAASLFVTVSAIIRSSTGKVVDMVNGRKIMLPNINAAAATTIGIAIDDPRFNHVRTTGVAFDKWVETGSASSGGRPQTLMPSPLPNAAILTHNTDPNSDFLGLGVPAPWIYWPNRALKTAGEIGLQAFNENNPWRTIPLLGTAAQQIPVLDRFIANSNVHGRVNINSRSTNALLTAFNACPISGYPGQSSTALTPAQARNIADQVMLRTQGGTPLVNMSEVGNVVWPSGAITGLNRLESEGVIRDTAEILGVRQQLFTVLVAAQSLTDTGNVLGEQRGLAVVWRDPYADSAGHRPSFVRYFRWLND